MDPAGSVCLRRIGYSRPRSLPTSKRNRVVSVGTILTSAANANRTTMPRPGYTIGAFLSLFSGDPG